MTSPLSLAFIVLTGNEACNIEKCLRSIAPLGAPVFVIDSLSNDDTVAIAKGLGAQVLEWVWTNHADQFNWAVDHAPIVNDWVFRLDPTRT